MPSTNLKNTKKRDLNSDTEELLLSTGKEVGLILMVTWLRPIINLADLEAKGKEFLFTERKLSAQVVEKMKIKSVEDSTKMKEILMNTFDEERLIKCKVLKRDNNKIQLTINIPSLLIPYLT